MATAQVPARVRTARWAPPVLGRARRSSSAQGRGRGSRQAPPFLPGPLFHFRWMLGEMHWPRPGSASALAPQTQEGSWGLYPAAERADLGWGRRRGLCSRSHVPTLRGVRVFTSLVGAGPYRKAAAGLSAPCPLKLVLL